MQKRSRCYWLFATVALALAPLAATAGDRQLTDKTLVAWVSLTDTEQRAGSALTLIDDQERFDAIVFGERTPGKWMAGSDFFRRTPADQSAYPEETADARTVVEIVIAYSGPKVTIYRNAKPYAAYRIDRPQPFDVDATVLLGLRYVGGMGEIGFLSGTVEEARVYDVALDPSAIAALEPVRGSTLPKVAPKPLGWWTFEDGTVTDLAGTFPAGTLRGAARIETGRLVLNGEDAYAEIRRPREIVEQTMFYRPRLRETGRMWDTWLYLHDGVYYLYYLANRSRSWDNISLATSPDGVHWKEHGRLLAKRPDVKWMGTGSTWKSPNFETDGRYVMNFSEWRGPRQTIFFATSTDLVNWQRLDDRYEFVQDTRWYEQDGRWDCIYTIPRPGGGLFGYWTATPKNAESSHDSTRGGRFGFGETLDGVTWKALEPPETPGVSGGEVGAVERFGDRYLMMFGTHGKMITLVAESPQGPFRPARKNRDLLSGHTYFSRFFPTPDGVLVDHHAIARHGPVYFSPLKSTVIDDEGTLRLGWWPGNDALESRSVAVKRAEPTTAGPIAMLAGSFDIDAGVMLKGTIELPASKEKPPLGFWLECDGNKGAAALFDASGRAKLGQMSADGTGIKIEKRVDREMRFGKPARFRVLVKHSLLELYLDDILIECFSLPGRSTGRIGLIDGGDAKTFGELTAWYARPPEGENR